MRKKKVINILLFVIAILLLTVCKYVYAASYASYWKNWSQHSSDYDCDDVACADSMRKSGCLIVAQAKMLYDTGVDRSSGFNPDRYGEWLQNKEYIYSMLYGVALRYFAAPQYYAEEKGKSLVYMENLSDASNAQIWSNIQNNYRTIINVGGHYVYVDNEKSTQNNIIILDSSKDGYYYGERPLSDYGSSRVRAHVYWTDGKNLERELPVIEDAHIDIPSMTDDTFKVMAKISAPGGLSKVQFATWTVNYDENGVEQSDEISQDDKIYHVPTYNNTTGYYEYTVKKSEHNNESGIYRVHLIAFNKMNNKTKVQIQQIPMGSTVNNSLGDNFYARITSKLDNTNSWVLGLKSTTGNAPKTTIQPIDYSNEAQIWQFIKNSDKTYTIKNKKTGKVLDVEGGQNISGRSFIAFASNGQDNQKFYLMNYNNGIRIVPKMSSTVFGMDIQGAQLIEGSNIMLFESKQPNKPNQTFGLLKLATNLSLDQENVEMNAGDEVLVNATIEPFQAEGGLVWTSSDENIVTVQNNGVITAVNKGDAVVTVKTTDGSNITKTINVSVKRAKKIGLVEENGNTYFYNDKEEIQKGFITDEKSGKHYYANEDGVLQKGLIESNGKKYFYKDDYSMARGEFITIEGKIYYFGAASGALQKSGWYEKDGKKYYEDKTTGELAIGMKTIDNKTYYFNEKGIMQKGVFATVDGKIYYFGAASGVLQKSGWYEKDGKKYYEDKTTGEIAVGIRTIDNKTYYFNEAGVMQKGVFKTVDGKIYYFGAASGVLQKSGWYEKDGKKYYEDKTTGELAIGMKTIDNKTYYFNETGVMQKGVFATVDGKIYYFGAASGELQKNGWYEKDGKKYYEDKTTGELAIGLKAIDGESYYFNESGVLQKNGWLYLADKTYYADKSTGVLRKGLQTIGNSTYFFNEDGILIKGEFKKIDGKIYYFGAASGALQKSGWYEKDGKKYYEDKTTGEVAVGMREIDGEVYYFDEDGVNQKGVFAKVDKKIYYFGAASGTLQKSGWYEKDGKKYYEDKITGEIYTGEKEIEGKTYIFSDEGVLLS